MASNKTSLFCCHAHLGMAPEHPSVAHSCLRRGRKPIADSRQFRYTPAMNLHELIAELREPSDTKIVLLVADGLGGLPEEDGGSTELETARTPNLDTLTREGVSGLSIPVLPGITPGSGPGHLGLFGYDPLEYRIGRGILEALGIHFEVGPRDVAARGNFCTVDDAGVITDRRAGRPTTERCVAMCRLLQQVRIPGPARPGGLGGSPPAADALGGSPSGGVGGGTSRGAA